MWIRAVSKVGGLLVLAGLAGCDREAARQEAANAQPPIQVAAAPALKPAAAAAIAPSGAKPAAAPPVREKPGKRSFDFDVVPTFESKVDVGGIRLGMTVDEALAVLDARPGKAITYYSAEGITPEGQVTKLQRLPDRKRVLPLKPGQYMTEVSRGMGMAAGEESFKIVFAWPPERNVVAGVSMTVNADRNNMNGPLLGTLVDAVGKKYGKEHASAPPRHFNTASDSVSHRWLVSSGEDCYASFMMPTMDEGGLSAWAQQESSPAYQAVPQPGACATAVLLRAIVMTSGEYKDIAVSYTLTLGNEGGLFVNGKRHEALVAARQREWIAQRQKEVARSAGAPKL
jgi:hypothetical protein